MAELGTIRRDGDRLYIRLPRQSFGPIPTVGGYWAEVCPHAIEGLGDLAEGAVIDHEALLLRGELVVVREPPTRMDDQTFEALMREADAMGKAEQ